jgi:predicted nuclease of restriction endonuclease-like (RecB) superfamily
MNKNIPNINFELLSSNILDTHEVLQQSAIKAINTHITIRNWLIGFHIVTFEQLGEDRAKYGDKLLQKLASNLNQKALSFRNLKLFRQFYLAYPQIGQTVSAFLRNENENLSISLNAQSLLDNGFPIGQTVSAQLEINEKIPADRLVYQLSFSHLVLLLPIKEPIKRSFYEISAIKGIWSVAELKRQINSLFYERSGLSLNPEKLSNLTNQKANQFKQSLKSPYIFEFLGLKSYEVVEEKDLESALIDHLQSFMMELGEGFCFEARQKRILIDDEYYFVDLVFYHRILKCHVLIELKADAFKADHASQLNAYVAYYNTEVKLSNDNPTIGLLLCTQKGKKLVQYALAGMDKNLFVSKYLVQLPSEEKLIEFINKELELLSQ